MRGYIRIYGPPVYGAIKALEKMAIDLPQVCIMDPIIATYFSDESMGEPGIGLEPGPEEALEYFSPLKESVSPERCSKMISRYGEMLRDYDFFFEWYREPTIDQMNDLIKMIDKTLVPLNVWYTITFKK